MALRRCLAFLILLSAPFAGMSQNRTVAVTIDDLPYADGGAKPESISKSAKMADSVNRTILAALKKHHAPATGFVIESHVEELGSAGPKILKLWIRQQFDLGNHTYSHQNFSDVSEQEFKAEVTKGEKTFRPLMEQRTPSPQLFFRFPYNDTGDTKEKHDDIAGFLVQRGYRLAPSPLILRITSLILFMSKCSPRMTKSLPRGCA